MENIVVRQESVRNIIRERRMLEHLNHPFICNLRYSFQDIEYMYVDLNSAPKPRALAITNESSKKIQVSSCGFNERRRFAISHFKKDIY